MIRVIKRWLAPRVGDAVQLHTRARVAERCPRIDAKHDAALAYIRERGLEPTTHHKGLKP